MKAWVLFSLFLPLIVFLPLIAQCQNLAFQKTYSLSAPPNYQRTAPAEDKASLTDGIYTKGYFWAQPTTLGWTGTDVSIDIDLGEIQPIGSVSFNTARKTKVDVNYPKNIYVFLSADNIKFKYMGDIMAESDNSPGNYEVKDFFLNNINKAARFILLKVIPNGKVFFCDEIEVQKATKYSSLSPELIAKSDIQQVTDSLQISDFERKNLMYITKKLVLNETREQINIGNTLAIKQRLINKSFANDSLVSIKKDLYQKHAANLQRQFNTLFVLEKCSPWDSINEYHFPQKDSSALNYQFLIPKNGVQYGSFVITNNQFYPQQICFKILNSNINVSTIKLFSVPFIPSANYQKVADPLLGLNNNSISIESGRSAMFIFQINGIEPGNSRIQILLCSKGQTDSLIVESRTLELFDKTPINLNANVWAYLTYPMLEGRKTEAVNDLRLHHINTIVIPPKVIPTFESNDFEPFSNYLNYVKGFDIILLSLDYSTPQLKKGYKGGKFMSEDWKEKFIYWYKSILKTIGDKGLLPKQVYLYPYDEVNQRDIKDFEDLIVWAKKHMPGIQFYATLTTKESIASLLPLIDIAQLLAAPEIYNNLPNTKSAIWFYDIGNTPQSSVPAYSFYRLMSWKAFANNFTGIGFWNYASEGRDKKLNLITNQLIDPANSYSVIYGGTGNHIISSRRWEAFKLGIEDYIVIKLYERQFGKQQAMKFVDEVLRNPQLVRKADQIRNEMLISLTGN